jgi:hypothetical protein
VSSEIKRVTKEKVRIVGRMRVGDAREDVRRKGVDILDNVMSRNAGRLSTECAISVRSPLI